MENSNSSNNNISVLPEAFKVVPSLYKSKLAPLSVTPIRRLNVLDADFLPKFQMTGSLPNISLIQLDPHTAMEWGSTSYYVKVQKSTSSTYRLAVLFKFDNRCWGIYYLQKDLRLKNLKDLKDEAIEECVPGIAAVEVLEDNNDIDLSNFKMHPPVSEVPKNSPIKEKASTDPEVYIKQKYFSALYSNADLMFFSKSTFARLRLLVGSDGTRLENIVSLPLLDVDRFNANYDLSNDVFFSGRADIDSLEQTYRSKFFEDNVTEKNEIKLNAIKKKLKIREIKLQLVILMELVIIKQNNESPSNETVVEVKKKPSLVRKKNKKRRLVPTFVGTLVDEAVIEETTVQHQTLEACKSGVRKYLDMLIVVNSVGNELDLEDEFKGHSDIFDFLKNIIIPFYYKKLTPLCKELIKTVKGVGMKRRQHTKPPDKKLPALLPAVKLASLPPSNDYHLQSALPTKSMRTATLQSIPSMQRSNKSSLDEFFIEKPSLKRSASTVSSTKLLEKRTIDFSSSTNLKSGFIKTEPVSVATKLETTNKGIFGTTLPIQKSALEQDLKSAICEIGETPVKKQKTVNFGLEKSDNNLRNKLFEVAATPDNKRTTRSEIVESSAGTIGERSEINSSPLSLRRRQSSDTVNDMITSPIHNLMSSPIQQDGPILTQRLNNNDDNDYDDLSPFKAPLSSQKPVSSAIRRKQRELKTGSMSSLKRKRPQETNKEMLLRPGDPVFMSRSPFAQKLDERTLDGSPFQKKREQS